MFEQAENVNAGLEDEEPEDAYEGDLGDGAKPKGGGAGIIGFPSE